MMVELKQRLDSPRHRRTSRRLIRQAQEEFDAGDPLQASKKAWEAVVHRVKSIYKKHSSGRADLGSHFKVMQAAQALLKRADNPEESIGDLLITRVLHVNFYDDDLGDAAVQSGIAAARRLLDNLDRVDAKLSRDSNRRRRARKHHQSSQVKRAAGVRGVQ